jgi:hypothetical protein
MKSNSFKICLFVLAVSLSFNSSAQRADSLLNKLNTDYQQEKLYFQFDRSVYNPGETIWFKAYLFAGNFPSLISKTLYTELINEKGIVLQRRILPVIGSSAAGSLEIPSDITGTVYVRAYTKWMLNFDSSFLYNKAITIVGTSKSPGKIAAPSAAIKRKFVAASSSVIVQFFPEGGDLVQEVKSRIAFKSTDDNGMPVNLAGDILDNRGEKITSFVSIHDGMGKFDLQPENGKQYKAVWKDSQGKNYEKLLPPAKQNGIVLEVNNVENQIEFEIRHSSGMSDYQFVYVVAQMQQQPIYKAKVKIDKPPSAIGFIPTINLPSGIMQITVFTPDDKPLSERIVFANSSDYSFETGVNALVKDMDRRKKNVIRINMPDTLFCNLSVAVTDAALNSPQVENNIYSTLLLTSDIKGYVYNPTYYFSSDADSVANHLDLIMMTNGWRRFKWEDVLAGDFPKINYLPENYLSVEGEVHGMSKKLFSGKEINAVLEFKGHKKEFLNIPVQQDGKFSYSGMIFYDTAKFFYQFNNDQKKKLTSRADFDIKTNLLKTSLHLKPGNSLLPDLSNLDSATLKRNIDIYEKELSELQLKKYQTLKNVVVTKKGMTKKDSLDKEYTSGFFSGNEGVQSHTILPGDDPYFLASVNLFTFLQSRIAGLQINANTTDATIYWRNFETALFVDEIAQIKINPNGQVVQDPGYILALPMSEIAMVKIYDPPFSGANQGGPGGAIAVYLKKATNGTTKTKGLDFTNLVGYSPTKEFYSPDYSTTPQSENTDYRPTLYWNPYVVTKKNHQSVEITFYNNDITKKMKVIIEGVNENGKLTRVEKILQ